MIEALFQKWGRNWHFFSREY